MTGSLTILARRSDILAAECLRVVDQRITWAGRLAQLGDDYGMSGGSAADRRAVVVAMARIEAGDA